MGQDPPDSSYAPRRLTDFGQVFLDANVLFSALSPATRSRVFSIPPSPIATSHLANVSRCEPLAHNRLAYPVGDPGGRSGNGREAGAETRLRTMSCCPRKDTRIWCGPSPPATHLLTGTGGTSATV